MAAAGLIGYFDDEAALLAATRAARSAGLSVADAYTPYAVHGLDEAMGLRRSRLTWVCFAAGLCGGTLALGFELWTSAVSWPLNIGGKPFASVPAFIPVTFELTVLSAALASAAAFFFRSRLFPGRRAAPPPRVTDDRFALVLAADGAGARQLLERAGAVEIAAEGDAVSRSAFVQATAALSLLATALGACNDDATEPNFEYMPDMVGSAALESFSANPAAPHGLTMMAPPPGTVPRGYQPLHFGPGPEEAARAGRELLNPIPDVELARQRGEIAFRRFCSPCHGAEGLGDGLVARKFPRPPSLVADHARGLPDGQLFHVITFGQGVMPSYAQQVVAEDRWKIVRHLRRLQAIAVAANPTPIAPATPPAAVPPGKKEGAAP